MGTSPEFTASAQESRLARAALEGEGGHVDGRPGKWFVPRVQVLRGWGCAGSCLVERKRAFRPLGSPAVHLP